MLQLHPIVLHKQIENWMLSSIIKSSNTTEKLNVAFNNQYFQRQKNWMLKSSRHSWHQTHWKLNVAINNQIFNRNKLKVECYTTLINNWLFATNKFQIECCIIFFSKMEYLKFELTVFEKLNVAINNSNLTFSVDSFIKCIVTSCYINTKSVPCRSKVTITSDDIMECTVALSLVLISDHLAIFPRLCQLQYPTESDMQERVKSSCHMVHDLYIYHQCKRITYYIKAVVADWAFWGPILRQTLSLKRTMNLISIWLCLSFFRFLHVQCWHHPYQPLLGLMSLTLFKTSSFCIKT